MKVIVNNKEFRRIKNKHEITIDHLVELTRISRPTIVRLIYVDNPKTDELYLKAIIEAINKLCKTSYKLKDLIKDS